MLIVTNNANVFFIMNMYLFNATYELFQAKLIDN